MLSQERVERMVKDANFVSGEHPYAPTLFDDLCCHVRALAADVEENAVLAEQFKVACERAEHFKAALVQLHNHLAEDDGATCDIQTMWKIIEKGLAGP